MTDDFNFSTGMPSDEMAEYLQMFVDETAEQLDDLVEVLLVLETTPASRSHLNESFRLIHSIKGAAAMMGLDSITLLTHHLENHFEHLRSGIKSLDREMMDLILQCVDFLRNSIETIREGRPLVSAPTLIEQLSIAIAKANDATAAAPSTIADTKPPLVEPRLEHQGETNEPSLDPSESLPNEIDGTRVGHQKRVIVYLDRNIDLPELKCELILARLSDMAVLIRTSPSVEDFESLAELRTLQVWLQSTSDNDQLRAAADIVGVDLVEIDDYQGNDIERHDYPATIEPVSAALTTTSESIPEEKTPPQIAPPTDGNVNLTSQGATAEQQADATLPELQSKVVETVRVDIQRLDRLMNLAGELVVNRARFLQLASQMTETFKKSGLLSQLRDLCDSLRENLSSGGTTDPETVAEGFVDDKHREIQLTVTAFEEQLQVLERGRRSFLQLNEAIDQFSRVSDRLQRGVLDTRMVPVGPLFNRFKRTVRDISNEVGKKVSLVIRGENTELDKRMIDELGDPLMHLVRNAIDHGLESESVRRSRGKPEEGTLTLEAVHSGNNVLITISDDGGGINTEKVKRRAIERRLVTATEAAMMSDFEIAQFIWAPGFSTAEVISDISGRGVGMDIVKTRIGELNGTVEVDSTIGIGTKFVIRLPLTLAIIRSLLFKIHQGTFAAPIENVREIVSINHRDILSVHGRNSIEVRGDFVPLVRIDDVFDWHQTQYNYAPDFADDTDIRQDVSSVLIMTSGTKSMALVVSELKGCQDIVVKSLDENFTHIRGLAGASILGDGSVCLLLDVVSCLELARQRLRDQSHRTMTTTT